MLALPVSQTEDAIARCLAAWLKKLENGSPSTLRNYKREAQAFLQFLSLSYGPGLGGLLKARPSDCVAFVNANQKIAPASRAMKAAVIRGLFGALVLEELRQTNPASELGLRNVQSTKHHQAIPQAAIITVLEQLKHSDKPQHIRDRALLLLTLAVAARRFEIAQLNVGSIERIDGGKAQVVFLGKGGFSAQMTVKPNIVKAIDKWLHIAGHGTNPSAPLFHNLSRRPEHYGKRLSGCGIRAIVKSYFPKYSPHGLRSRSVTDVWQQSGGNLGHAQAFARHSSPAITERIYVQAEKLEQATEYTFDYA
jgi:site-specific recombinase XerC